MQQKPKSVYVGCSIAHLQAMIRSQWFSNPLSSYGWLPSELVSGSYNGFVLPRIDLFDAFVQNVFT